MVKPLLAQSIRLRHSSDIEQLMFLRTAQSHSPRIASARFLRFCNLSFIVELEGIATSWGNAGKHAFPSSHVKLLDVLFGSASERQAHFWSCREIIMCTQLFHIHKQGQLGNKNQ